MRTPEGYEKADLRKYLDSIGAYHYWPTTFGMGPVTNDGFACIPPYGRFWLLEVKREGKGPTKRQEDTANEVRTAGGIVLCGTAKFIIPRIQEHLNTGGSYPYD
jgi:hypothetical protein